MTTRILWIFLSFTILLTGCMPVKTIETNQYKLNAYTVKRHAERRSQRTILITETDAASAYQSKQMLYMKQSFAINSFAHHAWISPPAEMIFPLIIQSVQSSGYFRAVIGKSTEEPTDFRLNTELIELEQNFLQKPSTLQLSLKADLADIRDSRIIASKVFRYTVRCPYDTPYGGVIAANQATKQFTADLLLFMRRQM